MNKILIVFENVKMHSFLSGMKTWYEINKIQKKGLILYLVYL